MSLPPSSTTTANAVAKTTKFSWQVKPQDRWPQPELSIGVRCAALDFWGRYKCWTLAENGPADRMWKEASGAVIDLLQGQLDHLEAGDPELLVVMFMVGRKPTSSSPTILFISDNKRCRRKAMEFVDKKAVLNSYKGVLMAQSSRLPKLLALGEDLDIPILPVGVYLNGPLRNFGTAVLVSGGSGRPGKRATIGGPVFVGNSLFGTTTAHAFHQAEVTASNQYPQDGGDPEFAFYGLGDPYNGSEEDDNLAEITSQGSYSTSSDKSHSSMDMEDVQDEQSTNPQPKESATGPRLKSASAVNLDASFEKFGTFDRSGSSTLSSPGSDWALIAVENNNFRRMVSARPMEISWKGHKIIPSTITAKPSPTGVLICTGSDNEPVEGTLSAATAFSLRPRAKKFQQLWIVTRAEGAFSDGDCGSWVFNSINGDVYGHIVSGYPTTNTAYILPFIGVFEEVQQHFEALLSLTLKPENLASMSQKVGQSSSNHPPVRIGKTLEYRRTRPYAAIPAPAHATNLTSQGSSSTNTGLETVRSEYGEREKTMLSARQSGLVNQRALIDLQYPFEHRVYFTTLLIGKQTDLNRDERQVKILLSIPFTRPPPRDLDVERIFSGSDYKFVEVEISRGDGIQNIPLATEIPSTEILLTEIPSTEIEPLATDLGIITALPQNSKTTMLIGRFKKLFTRKRKPPVQPLDTQENVAQAETAGNNSGSKPDIQPSGQENIAQTTSNNSGSERDLQPRVTTSKDIPLPANSYPMSNPLITDSFTNNNGDNVSIASKRKNLLETPQSFAWAETANNNSSSKRAVQPSGTTSEDMPLPANSYPVSTPLIRDISTNDDSESVSIANREANKVFNTNTRPLSNATMADGYSVPMVLGDSGYMDVQIRTASSTETCNIVYEIGFDDNLISRYEVEKYGLETRPISFPPLKTFSSKTGVFTPTEYVEVMIRDAIAGVKLEREEGFVKAIFTVVPRLRPRGFVLGKDYWNLKNAAREADDVSLHPQLHAQLRPLEGFNPGQVKSPTINILSPPSLFRARESLGGEIVI
ncbi:hypothetical protein G7Y89_g12303 [Cudoniella acicularis]|uniref:Uncharacterized protein n=1 Tax=Cudoniella acicularis TaxID=354080 RepID=A0A8H4RAP6_9HELO|nr:hypothetical protein G7Y89_g12303 [Cudoniella acicularis]